MALRVLTFAIAGVIEHRRRRALAAKRPIVAHINPTSPGIGLAFGQHRDGRVIAMQAFGCKDMGLNPPEQRFERGTARSYGIRHGRQSTGTPSRV